MHPEIGGEEDLLLCSGDDIGHVPTDVWYRCYDGEWAHTGTAHQRGRAHSGEWILLQCTQDIVEDLVLASV